MASIEGAKGRRGDWCKDGVERGGTYLQQLMLVDVREYDVAELDDVNRLVVVLVEGTEEFPRLFCSELHP